MSRDVERIMQRPKLIYKKSEVYCSCISVFVVEQTRALECQKCGKILNAFEYCKRIAKKQNNVYLGVKILLREKEILYDEVEDLKRQRKNLKAQIKRLDNR